MKYFKNGIIRAAIPFIIMMGIAFILTFVQNDAEQGKSTFFSGLIATSVVGSSVLYDVENWKLLKQSIIHFLCMLLTVFPCLIFSGWFQTETFLDYLKIFGIFIIVGIIFWTISYIVFGKLLNRERR